MFIITSLALNMLFDKSFESKGTGLSPVKVAGTTSDTFEPIKRGYKGGYIFYIEFLAVKLSLLIFLDSASSFYFVCVMFFFVFYKKNGPSLNGIRERIFKMFSRILSKTLSIMFFCDKRTV